MPIRGIARCHLLIYQKIKANHYPSLRNIIDYLEDAGFQMSDRTFYWYIDQIRNEFSINILFVLNRNGYYIEECNAFKYDNFLRPKVVLVLPRFTE